MEILFLSTITLPPLFTYLIINHQYKYFEKGFWTTSKYVCIATMLGYIIFLFATDFDIVTAGRRAVIPTILIPAYSFSVILVPQVFYGEKAKFTSFYGWLFLLYTASQIFFWVSI